jgi:5-methyltetrahydrofolate--homocysteine methyltransferase
LKYFIEDIIKTKILILDGALGTMIQKHKLLESDYRGNKFKDHPRLQKGNNDLLTLTKPEIIKGFHREYLEAGADIITTNTFNSNRISMSDYGMESLVYDLNLQSALLAVEAITEYENSTDPEEHFVAGSIGPTNRTASMSSDVNDPEQEPYHLISLLRHIQNR